MLCLCQSTEFWTDSMHQWYCQGDSGTRITVLAWAGAVGTRMWGGCICLFSPLILRCAIAPAHHHVPDFNLGRTNFCPSWILKTVHLIWPRQSSGQETELKQGIKTLQMNQRVYKSICTLFGQTPKFLVSRRIKHCSVTKDVNILLTWGCHPHVHLLWAKSTMWPPKRQQSRKLSTLTGTLSGSMFHVRWKNSWTLATMTPAEIKQDHRDGRD